MAGSPTSIRALRHKLGRTRLLDPTAVKLVRALADEVPVVPGVRFFGFVEKEGDKLVTDNRGRAIIKLTDEALASLETAVETVGHELHHVRESLAGAGPSEVAADAAGKGSLRTFLRRLAQLD